MYIPIPELREFSERELKAWLRENEERVERGEKARERTAFHESTLQIAVYDETDQGGKGACLGVLRLEEDDMVKFFDCPDPHETWYVPFDCCLDLPLLPLFYSLLSLLSLYPLMNIISPPPSLLSLGIKFNPGCRLSGDNNTLFNPAL